MSKPEEWKSWEGRVVEIFPLQQWLGSSDHSAVFLTEIPGASQRAAIKIMQAETGADAEQQVSRLRATAKLSHPNLIRIFQAGQSTIDDTKVVYVVTECADDDLSQILPTRPLENTEVSALLPPLLGALSYLHESGRVHGRIKPSNVLAVGDRLKLSSDQITSIADQNSHHRRRDAYDAPETAAGIVSPAGDIWSLGATLVAALTQNVSFGEDSQRDPGLPATLSEPYRTIARECLHLDPKKRWSVQQIEAELKPDTRSVPAPLSPPVPVPAKSRKRPAFPLTIATVVVLAVFFVFSYFRGNKNGAKDPDPRPPTASAQPPTAASPAVSESPKAAKASTTTAGEVRHQVVPDVPHSAKNTITGTVKVTVRAQVDPSGKVTSASFKSAGPSRYFAGLAMKAAESWEFSPPETDGQPLASTWLIQFRFKRTSTQASAQRLNR